MKASNLSPVPDRNFAGTSDRFLAALRWADRVAATSLAVYICGETGTGKEAVARRIHDRSSARHGPYVTVNCAALADSLLEAELFGVRRGAFTGAEQDRPGLIRQAHGGTLFLDEVGDMSPALQTGLLRVVQEGRIRSVGGTGEEPVALRWLCASHRRLEAEIGAGRFRRDLYHRLCTLRVDLPPLRDRLEDLPLLVEALGPRVQRETGMRLRLRPLTMRLLEQYPWPGNVRELHGVLAEALLRAGGRPVEPFHLSLEIDPAIRRTDRDDAQPQLPFDSPRVAVPQSGGSADYVELQMIREVLQQEQGNLTRSAERIGWSRSKLYRRLRFYGLKRES